MFLDPPNPDKDRRVAKGARNPRGLKKGEMIPELKIYLDEYGRVTRKGRKNKATMVAEQLRDKGWTPPKKLPPPQRRTDHPLMVTRERWDEEKVVRTVCDYLAVSTIGIVEYFDRHKVYVDPETGKEWPMISKGRFLNILRRRPDLYKLYQDVKSLRGDLMYEEALQEARHGGFSQDGEKRSIQRSKLIVDTLLQQAAHYNPAYNPKTRVEHSGRVDSLHEIRQHIMGSGVEKLEDFKVIDNGS